jgi:hypothetical protein
MFNTSLGGMLSGVMKIYVFETSVTIRALAALVTNPSPSFPRMRESIAEFPGFLHSQE